MVEAFTPGISLCTVRARAVGEICPCVRITSATMARRCGVMRRPLERRTSTTAEVVGSVMLAMVAARCNCKRPLGRLGEPEDASGPGERGPALDQLYGVNARGG